MDRLRYLLVVASLCAAVAVQAVPITFAAMDGERRVVAGATVCFYQAGTDDFVAKFLATNITRCLPADEVVDVPAGDWNVYLHHGEALVSGHPLFLHIADDTGDDAGDAGERVMEVPLLKAATVAFGPAVVRSGRGYGAVYVTNEGQPESPAAIRPVPAGATEVLVPANMRIVPMLVRAGRPVWIGAPAILEPGKRLLVDQASDVPGASVAAVLSLGPGEARRIRESGDETVDPPSITLIAADGKTVTPAIPLRPTPQFERSLVLFRNVPPGAYRLVASGKGWHSTEAPVRVPAGGVVLHDEGLRIRRAARMKVHWRFDPPPAPAAACKEGDSDAPAAELRVSRCDGPGEDAQCTVVERRELPRETEGAETFEDLDSGPHRVELVLGREATSATIDVPSQDETSIAMVRGAITGRVSKKGTPLRAVVHYGRGASVTDGESGGFVIQAKQLPRRGLFIVESCDGGPAYRERPSRDLAAGDVYDIEVPSNALHVRVTSNGRMPYEGAAVFFDQLGGDDEEVVFREQLPATDAEGKTSWSSLPAEVPLRVCAAAPQHATACRDLKLDRDDERSVELTLLAAGGRTGRVVSQLPVRAGTIFVVVSGRVIDSAEVASDGAFALQTAPPPSAAILFSAASHPLSLARPVAGGGDLRLEVASPPGRSVTVRNDGASRYPVAVQIGEVLVPTAVLWQHQAIRGLTTTVMAGRPLVLADLAPGERISILRGFPAGSWPPGIPPGSDPFTIPDVVSQMPRRAVGADGSVSFD